MTRAPRLFAIPPGAPFLPTLADALLDRRLIDGFPAAADPLALADAVIYVPTRRAARQLRAAFAGRDGAGAALLPSIRPLGEFDEDLGWFDASADDSVDPPVDALERRLRLAPLVHAWKQRLPGHIAAKFAEGVVVPATMADALWLADDLSRLIDEVEAAEASWERMDALATGQLAGWWEVTLEFLRIVTKAWPDFLKQCRKTNPGAFRTAAIRAEAARLAANPPSTPVIAAGSTGSIRATAELLKTIAFLPRGAVVLPGFDLAMDAATRAALGNEIGDPTIFGHPQFGMVKLLGYMGATVADVVALGAVAAPLASRAAIIADALSPAALTDLWPDRRGGLSESAIAAAFADVAFIEAANERDEALAIAIALREAIENPAHDAALVTPDRGLARRVAAELLRFGVVADDSGGTPFAATPPGSLVAGLLTAAFRPGDPVTVLSVLKHPLLCAGFARAEARHAAETFELVALRGGSGRPDIAALPELLAERLALAETAGRPPLWVGRLSSDDIAAATTLARAVHTRVAPLAELRNAAKIDLRHLARSLGVALEALAAGPDGSLSRLYGGESGEALAELLRNLIASEAEIDFDPAEAPDVIGALCSSLAVKPKAAASRRVFLWGALEARLQSVDTLVMGGLNEGVWPRQPEPGQFLSRMMKAELALDPPERQIGQSAHDFVMAAGAPRLVLTRSARAGDAPAVASRWLERLSAYLGANAMAPLRARGGRYLALAAALDDSPRRDFAPRPQPSPPLALRPKRFTVTEVETLRRDPYAVYARRVLGLHRLEPLVRDPGAAERGTLLHDILAGFVEAEIDPAAPDALAQLMAVGRAAFDAMALPRDVEVAWWPRFVRTARNIIAWDRDRNVARRCAEEAATPALVGSTGVSLSGRADRIDIHSDGSAEILDFKTGSTPSKKQAHTLIAPQLALEAALLARGAFSGIGPRRPVELAHVRLRADGAVEQESILSAGGGKERSEKSAVALGEEAWARLTELLDWFAVESNGYRSRVLPLRERDVEGDYDHLARVLEWSAGGDEPGGEADPS